VRQTRAPRILVLSASAGAGHLRAAEAVEIACKARLPEATVRHVDTLELTPASFRRLYGQGYVDFVNHAPELLGLLYDRTNRPPRHPAGEKLRGLLERLNTRPFVKFLRDFEPDVVAHTHFLPAAIVAHEKRKRRFRAPHLVVVTDFDVHRFWVCPGVERYCVAREDNRIHLNALGAPWETLTVTGIPIDPAFATRPDPRALRSRHGMSDDRPLLLVLGGGLGVGPIETLVDALWASLRGPRLVVIAGRNDALRSRLEKRARNAPTPTWILGFTPHMHEWMALATLAITKPGGLTTSEALARGLPLVVTSPIPGQETRNATMLFEEGAAISGENPFTVGVRVARLLETPQRLAAMRRAATSLGRPRAAFDVAEAVAGLLGV
jgi:processive 1,2-diacylglycerol beta-glucosyltransferase